MEQVFFLQQGVFIGLLAAFTDSIRGIAGSLGERVIQAKIVSIMADKTDRGFGRRTALANDRLTAKAEAHGQPIVTSGLVERDHNVVQNIDWMLVGVYGAGAICGHGICRLAFPISVRSFIT